MKIHPFAAAYPMMTGAAMKGLARENGGQVPGPDFPLMPENPSAWFLKVCDVLPPRQKAEAVNA
jgi:hypothetical protein